MELSKQQIRKVIREQNLEGQSICIHSSFRSLGKVEGGPDAVIDAFLQEGCTVMVPTFSNSFRVDPPVPPYQKPLRNGLPEEYSVQENEMIYNSELIQVDIDTMGAIPSAMLRRKDRVRGQHPVHSFTAVGPQAERLIRRQLPLNLYAAFEQLVDDQGYVILMGVGLNRMTLLHYAEMEAGRKPFIRWAKNKAGKTIEVHVGGCSEGFNKLDPALDPITTSVEVGTSLWRILPAASAVMSAAEAIRNNPTITQCSNSNCERCRDIM